VLRLRMCGAVPPSSTSLVEWCLFLCYLTVPRIEVPVVMGVALHEWISGAVRFETTITLPRNVGHIQKNGDLQCASATGCRHLLRLHDIGVSSFEHDATRL